MVLSSKDGRPITTRRITYQNFGSDDSSIGWYGPFHVLVTTPPTVLALAVIGLFVSRIDTALRLFLVVWVLTPIVRTMLPGMRNFDGVRHFLEFYPPLALLAAMALVMGGCSSTHEMTHQHHTIDYIEFAATDLPAAKRFYAAAFGWTFTDYGPDYAGIQRVGGGEVGGIRQDARVQRGGPLVVLYSVDLEASLRAVLAAGGQVVKDPFAFPGGRRFHFTDPAGNELAAWSDR